MIIMRTRLFVKLLQATGIITIHFMRLSKCSFYSSDMGVNDKGGVEQCAKKCNTLVTSLN